MFTVVRGFRLLLLVCLVSFANAAPCAAEETTSDVPQRACGTVQWSGDLRSYVTRMLTRSPTFRAQYDRIVGRPGVIVSARLDATIANRSFNARSIIRRYDSGLIVVEMSLAPGSRVEEYIAHEFEHIVEQLEGVDLAALARRGARDVWFSGGAQIETSRATRAGKIVMDELRSRSMHPDNLVE